MRNNPKLLYILCLLIAIFVVNISSAIALGNPSANIYTPTVLNEKERTLKNVEKNINNYKFELLKAGNTTPAAWIVKDKNNNNVALLKCTAGNNYAQAEIAAYYLGRKLDFPIFPVTIALQVDSALAKKLKIKPQTCGLKEWMTNWAIFYWKSQANLQKIIDKKQYQAYSQKNTFLSAKGDNRKLADTLMCNNNLNTIKDTFIELSSGKKTRNGDPLYKNLPTYFVSDPVRLTKIAAAFSNIMVLDAVFENGDRFPGKNLEFRSSINESELMKNGQMRILQPQLSSLDTGLSFKGWHNTWARLEITYYLRRFDPMMISKLKKLLNELDHLEPDNLPPEWAFLDFNTQSNSKISAVQYLKDNIQWVLAFVEKVQEGTNKEVIPNKKAGCKQLFF